MRIINSRPFKFIVPKELKGAQEDLDWLFQHGEAALGVKSNFDALISAKLCHAAYEEANAEDQLLEFIDNKRDKELTKQSILNNTTKYRSIYCIYTQMSKVSQNILEHFYYEKQYGKEIEQSFGAGIGLIPFTKTFDKLKINNVNSINDSTKQKLRKEIKNLYVFALEEYARIK